MQRLTSCFLRLARSSPSTPSASTLGPPQFFISILTTNERNFRALRQIDERGFLEQEGATGFDGDGTHFRLPCDAQSFGANDGNIETHILIRLRHLDHDRVLLAEQTAPPDCFIRAFKSFYREDRPAFHDDGLTDVERAKLFRNLKSEVNVFFFGLFEFRAGNVPGRREEMIEKGRGGQELDVDFRELITDRAEDRFGVALP